MPSTPASQRATDPARTPLLTLIAVLVLFEAALLVAGAVYLVHGLVVDGSSAPVAVVSLVVTALLLAAGVAFCGHGLLRKAAWARSPVVVWQLLQLAAGLPAFSGGSPWLGLLLVAPALVVGVGLFLPSISAQVGR
ncbi:hypothetical protein [Kineococcus sp. SYSU DK003]|uniref:hypothetical protein n=1 Tax=Kineococcus sp. SYSU DK003 TaxID=3383124 RepID=UPI003D7E705B